MYTMILCIGMFPSPYGEEVSGRGGYFDGDMMTLPFPSPYGEEVSGSQKPILEKVPVYDGFRPLTGKRYPVDSNNLQLLRKIMWSFPSPYGEEVSGSSL